MNLPTYLRGSENDNQSFFEEMFLTLLEGLSNNGWTVPNLTTAQITAVQSQMPVGTLWFNTSVDKLQVKTSGGIETITSS